MPAKLPVWFNQKASESEDMRPVEQLLEDLGLHTICESAHCPNIAECFSSNTATFLILGDVCTRNCRFCTVEKGIPLPPNPRELQNILHAVNMLGLRYVVLTSVTRDDLSDGGASQFSAIIRILKEQAGGTSIEVLVPDLLGSTDALETVVKAGPHVINHNVEMVPRLYPTIRPKADYDRSICLLFNVKSGNPEIVTKSGIMLGLGETRNEVIEVMRDLREADCDLLTIGQYLQPSAEYYPIARFIPPEEFTEYQTIAKELGFTGVASSPLVRSSFQAAELYNATKLVQ